MRVPGAGLAHVDRVKIEGYLLSNSHPVGRFKAAFFRRLGYGGESWERLAEDLRSVALHAEVETVVVGPFGRKYTASGILTGPAGTSARITTVWIVRTGEAFPRLVTAYPGGRP